MLRKLSALSALCSLSLLLQACGSSSTPVSNTGGGTSAYITVSAASLTFPSTTVGQTSAAQTVTVTNTGNASATLTALTQPTGSNSSSFSDTTTCGTTLAALASCSISITFTPTTTGTLTALVSATDNATNSPQSIALTGTGVAAAVPTATLSPTSITFPSTNAGSTSAAQTLTLSNTGTAALSIASIALGGTNPADFARTNNCGSSLNASSSCTINVTFTPALASTTYTATLTVTDNTGGVTGSTQTATLTGAGASPTPTPLAVLSPTSLTFASTTVATSSATQTITLSNPGNATLTGIAISLTGTNATSFSETTTCGTTLAATNSCNIVLTFTPTTTGTLTATLSVADNATGSPQTASLTGTGVTASTITRTLYIFPEADNSATPLYALVNGAKKTIDMTMYALQDATFTNDLVAACARGVVVRVILDQNSEKSNDTPDFNLINAQSGCTAVWANKAFQVTHEKSFIVDSSQVSIMSLNLQSQYYSTTRDYALVENDPNDIAAVQATFNMDYAAGTTAAGVSGPSDFSYAPQPGTDLVWSPTTATTDMLAIINNATKTLYIENEELSASNIVSAIAAAATRGVTVVLIGEYSSSYVTNYATIKAAGGNVYYYSSSTGFYVHGKTVVADLGLSSEAVYMGSINYSTASLTLNRELGVYILNNTAVSHPLATAIQATIVSDESQPGVTHY